MTAFPTSPGSRTSASSTTHAPAGNPRARSVAIRTARRLLPTPPGPTRLTSRAVTSFFRSSASSRRRPMNVVASAGRLPARRAGLAMIGHASTGLWRFGDESAIPRIPARDPLPRLTSMFEALR